MLTRTALTIALAASLGACSKGAPAPAEAVPGSAPAAPASGKLTDETVVKYIAAYKALRAAGPGLAEKYKAGGEVPIDSARQDYAGIEDAIKKAGFSGYAEFVKANAQIAWAFNTAQGKAFLQEFDGKVSDGEKQIQEALANPEVPEEAKRELREQLKVLQATYAKNRKWADISMKVAGKLTDQESVDVILRHRVELEAAFRGE